MLPLQALYYRYKQYHIYMWEEYSLVETQSVVEFLLCQVNNFARVRYIKKSASILRSIAESELNCNTYF